MLPTVTVLPIVPVLPMAPVLLMVPVLFQLHFCIVMFAVDITYATICFKLPLIGSAYRTGNE